MYGSNLHNLRTIMIIDHYCELSNMKLGFMKANIRGVVPGIFKELKKFWLVFKYLHQYLIDLFKQYSNTQKSCSI